MADTTFKAGDNVAFTTPGRYPRNLSGTIESIDSAFAVVKLTDGSTRKARPGTLRAA